MNYFSVPRNVFRDIKDASYVQSTASMVKNNSFSNVLKQCHVSLTYIFADSDPMCSITKGSAKNCKFICYSVSDDQNFKELTI